MPSLKKLGQLSLRVAAKLIPVFGRLWQRIRRRGQLGLCVG
jgi:hypothetical protein